MSTRSQDRPEQGRRLTIPFYNSFVVEELVKYMLWGIICSDLQKLYKSPKHILQRTVRIFRASIHTFELFYNIRHLAERNIRKQLAKDRPCIVALISLSDSSRSAKSFCTSFFAPSSSATSHAKITSTVCSLVSRPVGPVSRDSSALIYL